MEPPASSIDGGVTLMAALLSRNLDRVRQIAAQNATNIHSVDQTGLSPAFHEARASLGLSSPCQKPALIIERPGEGRCPLDAAAVTQQFGYSSIDSLEFESVDILRKLLGARRLHALQRAVQTGDITETPWLAYQLHLSQKYAADIERGAHADIYIAHINKDVGWGVFAAQEIPSGSYVGEYVGVVRRAQPLGGDYAASYADLLPYCKLSVDSKEKGMKQRRNSKRPNVGWRDVFAAGVSHVVFVATRTIAAQEQLLVDYGDTYWAATGVSPTEL